MINIKYNNPQTKGYEELTGGPFPIDRILFWHCHKMFNKRWYELKNLFGSLDGGGTVSLAGEVLKEYTNLGSFDRLIISNVLLLERDKIIIEEIG